MRVGKKWFAAEVGSVTEQTFKYTKEQSNKHMQQGYFKGQAAPEAHWTIRQVPQSSTKATR